MKNKFFLFLDKEHLYKNIEFVFLRHSSQVNSVLLHKKKSPKGLSIYFLNAMPKNPQIINLVWPM